MKSLIKSSFQNQDQLLRLLGCAFLLLVWIYALAWAFSGQMLYRDQHFGGALVYYDNGIDLLRPVVPGFNANGSGTPQEFPLWQAVAALALQFTGGWWPSVTILTLSLFTITCLAWWQLGRQINEIRSGGLLVAFLLAQPLVFDNAGSASVDGFSLGLLLLFIWQTEKLRTMPNLVNFVLCAFITTLLAVTKLPFLLAGAFGACWILLWGKATIRSWGLLALCGVLSTLVFLIWNWWCTTEILRAEFRYRPMMLKEIPEWFFGTISMRLDPMVYIKGGWRSLNALWGSFILVGLTLYGFYRAPRSLGAGLLLGAIATTLIFFNLVLVHQHYYLMYAPGVALLNAIAFSDILSRITVQQPLPKFITVLVLGFLLGLSLAQGLLGINIIGHADKQPGRIGIAIANAVSPNEKVILVNGGWGQPFVESRRTYLSTDNTDLVMNVEFLKRLKELGYHKIGFVGESELLHAMQVTNPGQNTKIRITPTSLLCDETKRWKTIVESQDIIIKEIP